LWAGFGDSAAPGHLMRHAGASAGRLQARLEITGSSVFRGQSLHATASGRK